jgi:N-acyl-D-glutamate deacylase
MKTTRALQFFFVGFFSVLVIIGTASAAEKAAEKYDLVILGGRVMDPETGFDGVRNVGVVDGRITVITKDTIEGKETIDAKGHMVAPGFIDTHVHMVDIPFGQKLMLRDGVTTPLDLEVGAYPVGLGQAALTN